MLIIDITMYGGLVLAAGDDNDNHRFRTSSPIKLLPEICFKFQLFRNRINLVHYALFHIHHGYHIIIHRYTAI